MSARASVLSVFCLICALGLGYWAFIKPASETDHLQNTAALQGESEPKGEMLNSTQAAPKKLQGSANRRMDDFGAGPVGQVVTMPLKERYRQAYSGSTVGAGGAGPAPSTGDQLKGESEIANTADSAVSLASVKTDQVIDSDQTTASNKAPSYRVIDRGPQPTTDAATTGQETAETVENSPSFDIVRVDPLGNTILAGRASPFADVEVKVGDDIIDRVTATAVGEWVSTPLTPLESGDQELSLVATTGDGPPVVSRQVVVVSIPKFASDQEVAANEEPVAVLLDKVKSGEGRVLQAPGQLQGEGELVLKLVDYNDEGAIKLSGEAPAGAPVRIYLDNEPAALVISDAKGAWITTLDRDLPGGDYTLRLDQLNPEGETVARLETPFTRVTTPPVEGESKVDYVVVQPGNSLWRIARRLSGDGFNYVYIFEANQAQIRDPDVIYPGQVFEVPGDAEIAG